MIFTSPGSTRFPFARSFVDLKIEVDPFYVLQNRNGILANREDLGGNIVVVQPTVGVIAH